MCMYDATVVHFLIHTVALILFGCDYYYFDMLFFPFSFNSIIVKVEDAVYCVDCQL